MASLEVLFAPAEFMALCQRDLSQTICVVFDVLRATSTMVTALSNGAKAVIPVSEIEEALEIRSRDSNVLLAGERDGFRIEAAAAGGKAFDLGNSPREFTRERVAERTIVSTTTNGTRALGGCVSGRAKFIVAVAFLNLTATAQFLSRRQPENILIVCSGTHEQAAGEDILAAGALVDLLWGQCGGGAVSDSAQIAREYYRQNQHSLEDAMSQTRNGRRLLSIPELREDVAYCARQDTCPFVAVLGEDGSIRRV